MPDAHGGMGVTIGAVIPTKGAIILSAYKDIDTVMEHQNDLVEVFHTLKQVVNVRGYRLLRLSFNEPQEASKRIPAG